MRPNKLLLLFLFISVSCGLKAGHEVGGMMITYKSAPGPTNNPLRYEIIAYSVYDNSGIPAPTNANLVLSSSCYPNQTVPVSRTGTSGGSLTSLNGLGYCSGTATGSISLSMAVFKGFVTLPGTCSDFRLSTSSCCGRFTNMDNIAPNFSGSDYFYADLNNTLSPNSTPELNITDFIRFSCPAKPLNIYSFTETDGDSVYYSPSVPVYQSGSAILSQSYSAGYSISNPVGSTSGYFLNSSTGAVQTQVPNGGQYAITIKFEEYRLDATGSYVKISEGRFTPVLGIANSCTLPSFDLGYAPIIYPDSVDCGAQSLRVSTTRKISIASLSTDGSEFIINSQKNGAMSVSGVQLIQDSIVEITFTSAIASNDVLTLSIQNGTDGDGILSVCGQQLPTGPIGNSLTFYSPAVAAATASFIHNNNALNVSFNSSGSTGNSLIWDFGDGSPLSTMANPSHTYGSAGQYTVSLISLNRCGESDTLIQVIDVCDTLSAGNFTITQNGTTVTLTPSGSVGANSFMWDMGDGFTFSSTSGVSHTYMNSGTYTITLVAFNICGETDTIVQTIDLCDVLSAAFNYQQAANTVVFDGSISSSGATAFFWTLGDGSVATGANYTHTYTNLGNYYVTLLVVNACMDSAWYSDTIKLCTPAVPSWTYTITSSGSAGMVVQFDGSASQNAISYQWDFGDGTSGSGVAPQHTYTTVSLTYLVKLTVTNDCGEQESYAYRLNQIGLEELEAGQRIEFYPNPVKDKLTFKWQAENNQLKEVKIFNNSGQLMLLKELPQTKEGEMSYELNVSQLAKGLYILQLTGDNMNIRELLIIEP